MANTMGHGAMLDLDALLADEPFPDDLDDLLLPDDAGFALSESPSSLGLPTLPVISNAIENEERPSARVPWKNRRKEELEYLRQRAKELESQLRGLQADTAGKNTLGAAARVGARDAKISALFNLSWKSIAHRQLAMRQRAEAENWQLKKAINEYVMAAQRLQDLVHEKNCELVPRDWSNSFGGRLEWTPSDFIAANQLIQQVEAQYSRVESVLLQQMLRCQLHAKHTTQDGHFGFASAGAYPSYHATDVLYLDLQGASMTPFPFHRVRDVAWTAVESLFAHERGHSLESEANRVVVKLPMYNSSGFSRGAASDVVGSSLLVIQRFIEKDRMVLVWRCVDARSTRLDDCVASDVTGWCVLEPAASQSDSTHVIGTLLRGCAHAIPIISSIGGAKGPDELHQVTKKLTEGLSIDFKALKDMVEDSLLQEAMKYDKKAERA